MHKLITRLILLTVSLALGGVATGAESGELAAGVIRQAAVEVSYLSFDKALPLFEKALQLSKTGSEDWQAALFGKATCLVQITPATPARIAEAALTFRQMVEKYPQSKYTPQAMMALGRIDELVDYRDDRPRRDSARQWYEKACQASGDTSDLASEATLRVAGTYIQEMDTDSVKKGIAILTDWLARHPNNPLASAMWQYAGNSYLYPLADDARALDCYLKADTIGLLEEGREGPIYWRMANLADRLGRKDVAIRYYTRIIQKTPTSGKAYESQLALKRLGAPIPEIRLFSSGDSMQPATAPAAAGASQAAGSTAQGPEKP